jgi:SH3-like domain-containing protein
MRRRFLMFLLSFVLLSSSCTYSVSTPTAPAIIPATGDTAVPAAISPTPTVVPIETLIAVSELATVTETLTSTPSVTLASPRDQPVNCRVGPDISYAVTGALLLGNQAEVIGKNIDITWLYVRNPSDPSTNCWLYTDLLNVEGNVDLLPVVGPPEIMVTNVKVDVEPAAINVACDAMPQGVTINARITTNGPTIVTWYWESSTGEASPQKQILFEEGMTKTVQDYYSVYKVGDYSVKVKTIVPNNVTGEAVFKVICTP